MKEKYIDAFTIQLVLGIDNNLRRSSTSPRLGLNAKPSIFKIFWVLQRPYPSLYRIQHRQIG